MANKTIIHLGLVESKLTQRSNGRIDLFRDGKRVKTFNNLAELIHEVVER